MNKAIFVDIDGTLRKNNKNISTRTISTIKKTIQKGNLVILCSGRPRKYTEDVSKQCCASKYIISSDGGVVYDYEKEEIIYTNMMNKQACMQLYNIAQREKIRFLMDVGANRTVTQMTHFDGTEVELKGDINTFINQNDIVQCQISDVNFEKIKNLELEIKNMEKVDIKNQHKSLIDNNMPKIGTIYYDISNIETSKGNAIKILCERLNIDKKDTIAIGDDYNDISMFEVVGHSVVMENANDDVKKYANEVILSNEQDGVAVFLEKYIINGKS